VSDFESEAWVYVQTPEKPIYFRKSIRPTLDKKEIDTGIGPKSILKETEAIEFEPYINLTNRDYSYLYVFNNLTSDEEKFSLRYNSGKPIDLNNLEVVVKESAVSLAVGALAVSSVILNLF
jgi:hypothetical protein